MTDAGAREQFERLEQAARGRWGEERSAALRPFLEAAARELALIEAAPLGLTEDPPAFRPEAVL